MWRAFDLTENRNVLEMLGISGLGLVLMVGFWLLLRLTFPPELIYGSGVALLLAIPLISAMITASFLDKGRDFARLAHYQTGSLLIGAALLGLVQAVLFGGFFHFVGSLSEETIVYALLGIGSIWLLTYVGARLNNKLRQLRQAIGYWM